MGRRLMENGWINPEFLYGVEEFIKVAFADNQDMVKCPCKKCRLRFFMASTKIDKHLRKNGFMEDYEIWYCHGERGGRKKAIAQKVYRYLPITDRLKLKSCMSEGRVDSQVPPPPPLQRSRRCKSPRTIVAEGHSSSGQRVSPQSIIRVQLAATRILRRGRDQGKPGRGRGSNQGRRTQARDQQNSREQQEGGEKSGKPKEKARIAPKYNASGVINMGTLPQVAHNAR
ncbi:unnamed protein product [Cuscuta campestris]|uniref:Transposase-associated domain-containing protein n=1 Tax=Cuscuta campestris TaxID=132261 RepID=A0A484L3T9_9ASTE|nr:unnamed protein product [Cuscuta campestris]